MDISEWENMTKKEKEEFIKSYDENEEFSMVCEICGADMTKEIEVYSQGLGRIMKIWNIGKVVHPTKKELIESIKEGKPKLPYQVCRSCHQKIKSKETRWKITTRYYKVI